MKGLVYSVSVPRWLACKLAGMATPRAFTGPLSMLRLRELPVPELPAADWVRLRTILGGVCGTDLALVFQKNHPNTILQQFAAFPAVLGHENVAIIDAVGPAVPGHWRTGMRVCVDPALGCAGRGIDPPCSQCAAGRPSVCEAPGDERFPPRALIGLNRVTGGSWAEYFVAHQSQLHAVPDAVIDDHAVLVDPIASAAHAVFRRRPRDGEHILITGAGIVAFGVLLAIRALGHANSITLVARNAAQANLARRLGAGEVLIQPRRMRRIDRYRAIAADAGAIRLDGRMGNQALLGGYDLTYDCTGTPMGLTFALGWTRARGTLVAVGTTGISIIDSTPLWFDELTVIGANGRQIEAADGRQLHTYEVVFDWLSTGRLDLSPLTPSIFPLSEYRAAFAALANRGASRVLKVAFDPAARGGRQGG